MFVPRTVHDNSLADPWQTQVQLNRETIYYNIKLTNILINEILQFSGFWSVYVYVMYAWASKLHCLMSHFDMAADVSEYVTICALPLLMGKPYFNGIL